MTVELNQDLIKMVRPAIMQTWEVIAGDVEDAVASCGEGPVTNASAMETTIDANYLTMYGGDDGKEVDDHLSEVMRINGYDETLKFLSDNIRLG